MLLGGAHAGERPAEHVRVLVVEEHRLFAEGLRLLVEEDDRLEVVGITTTVEEATVSMRETDPDVALIGRCLANRSALEALGRVRGDASLVVVASTGDDELLGWALEAGAAAVVDDLAGPIELRDAVQRAGDGESLFSPAVIADVIRRRATSGRRASGRVGESASLTRREHQVLGLLVEGCDSKRIASRLGLSVDTARDYVQNILEKLGAHSRVEAVVRAGRLGLINIVPILIAFDLAEEAFAQIALAAS